VRGFQPNEDAAMSAFAEQGAAWVEGSIMEKIERDKFSAMSQYDPDSIMHYCLDRKITGLPPQRKSSSRRP
jgi:hypothetical protein